MKAYVFITTTTRGEPREVARQVARITGVTAADLCWGLPDIIAVADVAEMKALETTVVDRIQKLDGVDKTDTHIVVGS
jgi:DNA-binding Lrp family transcriptional regulator